jgi:hypothetical protein
VEAEISFTIDLRYTAGELDLYRTILSRHCRQSVKGLRSGWVGPMAIGFVGALIGGFVSCALGVPWRNGGVVAALIFAGYYSGLWVPALLLSKQQAAQESPPAAGSMVATPRGIAVRRPGIRAYFARSSIQRVSLEGGLLLLWFEPYRAIVVPTRLLSADQQRLLSALPTNLS